VVAGGGSTVVADRPHPASLIGTGLVRAWTMNRAASYSVSVFTAMETLRSEHPAATIERIKARRGHDINGHSRSWSAVDWPSPLLRFYGVAFRHKNGDEQSA